ncbi:MAG: hypothetical protein POELPBGB_01356 [Bacteroidia bacterium]|nr:hypothetical protein [Bacteroidia bacterium]
MYISEAKKLNTLKNNLMKNVIVLLTTLIMLNSCTKKCPQWYEGDDCKQRIVEQYTGHWLGTVTETDVTVGGQTFSDNISNADIYFYIESTTLTPANEMTMRFRYHCYCGFQCGCLSNPNVLDVIIQFTSETSFDIKSPWDTQVKYGEGTINVSGNTLSYNLIFNNSNTSGFPVTSGTFSFSGIKQ